MKTKFRIALMLLLFIFSISLTACKNTYDTMLEDFNKKYFAAESGKDTSVEDDSFIAEDMLSPVYDFYEGYSSSLLAPADAASYLWKSPKENTSPVEYKELCKEREFSFMPGRDFAVGSETKVILTVTSKSGTEYIDTTIIRINRDLPI